MPIMFEKYKQQQTSISNNIKRYQDRRYHAIKIVTYNTIYNIIKCDTKSHEKLITFNCV